MQSGLKRLLKNSKVYRLVEELVQIPFVVENWDGEVLYAIGNGGVSAQRSPILIEGQAVGWVVAEVKSAEIASLLTYYAKNEYEKQALSRETLERYKEITLLYDFAEKMTTKLDPKEVSKLVLQEAKRLIKGEKASLMIIDEETGLLEKVVAIGGEIDGIGHKLKIGEGIAGNVALTAKAEIIENISLDPRNTSKPVKAVSLMCAPLTIKGKTLGVINISEKKKDFTAEDLKILTALAFQASAAIENAKLYSALKETFFTVAHSLAESIEKRDPYTGGHTLRVMEYSMSIAMAMGIKGEEMERVRYAAVLHDIGKIGIRDNILLKKGKLESWEFEEIKKHAIYGEELLKHIKFFKDIIPGVKHHHERFDGTGYPDGLKGEEINLISRIIAVGDTFDAMTTDRPYRNGLPLSSAVEEIGAKSGTQFDPQVVNAFFRAYGIEGMVKR